MKDILAKTISDPKALRLCAKIIDSGAGVLNDQYTCHYFEGDDLFAASRPRGLPIGNLTSQFWANVYLNELDQFVKHGLGAKGYVRYVDDFLLFADDKQTLALWLKEMIDFLASLRLTIHLAQAQPCPVGRGIPFLGFTVYPDHRRLKASRALRYRRHFRTLRRQYARRQVAAQAVYNSMQSWRGHIRHGDTQALEDHILGNGAFLDGLITDLQQDRKLATVDSASYRQFPQA